MKILLITLNLVHQGTYWRAYHLGKQLARRGHQVTLLATGKSNRVKFKVTRVAGVELVESPDLWQGMLRSGYDPWNTICRIGWLRGREYDLVHGFEARPTVIYPALAITNQQKIPLIIDWADWFGRGGSVEERTNPVLRTLLRPIETYFEEHFRPSADGNTVINSTLYERAINLGISPERLLLLSNGADTERITPMSITEARARRGQPQDSQIIGYVGTIFKRDAEFMAAAFDQLQTHAPGTRLLVMGRCPIDIRVLVKKPELVEMTGIIEEPQLTELMAGCDLFWLPLTDSAANRGRLPLKYADYLAAGRPIIATAVGEISQVFKQGEVGLLTRPDPESFTLATVELLHSADQMLAMGIAARKMAERYFDWAKLTDELIGFYQKIQLQK